MPGGRWVPIGVNAVLEPGDWLRTGPTGRVTLVWSDTSVARFGPLTELEIRPPHATGAERGLYLFKGLLSFFHRGTPGRIRVVTRGAAAGIKGTEFVVAVEEATGRTTISLIDGVVEFTNDLGSIELVSGQAAVASPTEKPQPAPGFIARNILQWCFYYPGVLDDRELPLTADERRALEPSLASYRAGDLLAALTNYPAARQAASEAERTYYAALLLSVGQVAQSEPVLVDLQRTGSSRIQQLAGALRQLITAVKGEATASTAQPELATGLLAASYYEQSRALGDETLNRALQLARAAATNSPDFGFAWARVAELEFSFGRTRQALGALERSLELSRRNAQALALKGFLLAAQNKPREAIASFDEAIAVDAALGNAWLGRGLCRIRRGDLDAGREDLLIAAALEPQRAALRSYLGKAYGESNDKDRALHELELAKGLDDKDPTPWLYSALVKAEHNRINEAIGDLERSQELNDNRSVYRSSLSLDQDRSVRSANLALLYDDAGLTDVALWEGSRAVTADYDNYSAHLFLANSYLLARDETSFKRFETSFASEFLLTKLLGPADGRILAQSAGQQEYSSLFERDKFGISSRTEYFSYGAWKQAAVQYGTYRNSSYAIEGNWLWDPGETHYRENEQRFYSATVKYQVTQRDGLLIDIRDVWQEFGDIRQRYNPNQAIRGLWATERQEPNILVGFDHQWSELHRTLFVAGRVNRSFDYTNKHSGVYLLTTASGDLDGFFATDLTQKYEIESTFDTLELQHLFAGTRTRTIAGIRFQASEDRVFSRQTLLNGNAENLESYFGTVPGTLITNQYVSDMDAAVRVSPYLYEHWHVVDSLWLIGGVSYDYQEIPVNIRFGPVGEDETTRQQVSPKAAFVWTPHKRWTLRGAYSQSLGGVDLDQNLRIEPVQLAGFIQAYKTVFPTSLVGPVSGAHFETYDLSLEHRGSHDTYTSISGQFLHSTADRTVGAYRRELLNASGPGVQLKEHLRFDELSLRASVRQLLGDYFSVGVEYDVAGAHLRRSHPTVPDVINFADLDTTSGVLHIVSINGLFRHPTGFFARGGAYWRAQNLLGGYPKGPRGIHSDDDFWQVDVSAGYRFPRRRAEITVGVLNITAQDYRLYPINLYPDLPRERTFYARLDFNF